MPEMWPQDGKNRKRRRSAPEKMPALRRQGGAAHFGIGPPVQRFRLVRHRLRWQKIRLRYPPRRQASRGIERLGKRLRSKRFRRKRLGRQGFGNEREEGGEIREVRKIR